MIQTERTVKVDDNNNMDDKRTIKAALLKGERVTLECKMEKA